MSARSPSAGVVVPLRMTEPMRLAVQRRAAITDGLLRLIWREVLKVAPPSAQPREAGEVVTISRSIAQYASWALKRAMHLECAGEIDKALSTPASPAAGAEGRASA